MDIEVRRRAFNKRELFDCFLQSFKTGLLCKVYDLGAKDEEDDFLLVYGEVFKNTPCPFNHLNCDRGCGHAEANLISHLDAKAGDRVLMETLLADHSHKMMPDMTILMNNSPCQHCSKKLLEFFNYYKMQNMPFSMTIKVANIYKGGQQQIPQNIKAGLLRLHKAGVKLEPLSIDIEKPFFRSIDEAIDSYQDLTEAQKVARHEQLGDRRMKDLRTAKELEEILKSVGDLDSESD